MKIIKKNTVRKLKDFIILWSTQSVSQLGSSMTAFALTLWLYEKTGSALSTALLAICSYVPYVCVSIFAGALTDRFNKKRTMLVCDTLAAASTVVVYVMLRQDLLEICHLYLLNAVNGLMNTVQQPASDVAMTLVIPKEYYQKTSGLRSFSQSLITMLHPVIATALYAAAGMNLIIAIDLGSFLIAFAALLLWVRIPDTKQESSGNILELAKEGMIFLRHNPLVLTLILFLAGVNLVASAFDAVLPGYVIPNPKGGRDMLGIVSSCAGAATLIGSVVATVMPKPKNRVRIIYVTMLFSLSIENFLLAFSRQPILWCLGQLLGWSVVPVMSTNLDVILRSSIPVELQGRVYACRNTLQFFTIPLGLFLGGFLVDHVCEPLMSAASPAGIPAFLFGCGKGSGAALMMFILGVSGTAVCLTAGLFLKKYEYHD